MIPSTALVLTLFSQLAGGKSFLSSDSKTMTSVSAAQSSASGFRYEIVRNVRDGRASRVEVERCEVNLVYHAPTEATGFCHVVTSNRYDPTGMARAVSYAAADGRLVVTSETLAPHLCFNVDFALQPCQLAVVMTLAKTEAGAVAGHVETTTTWLGRRAPPVLEQGDMIQCDLITGIGCGS